jgi:DNA-binding response OmpR family regulator
MSPKPCILIVEDERSMGLVLETTLSRAGYRPLWVGDGETGLRSALHERPDLVILDVGLPEMDGVELCQRLRALQFEAPILMLTGRVQLRDRVEGLEAGADDYLAKPFQPEEFLARIRALLRRQRRAAARSVALVLGDVQIDLAAHVATRAGQPLALTKTEFSLLDLLARHDGQPVTREEMLNVIWGYSRSAATRTIDTHIWRLRKKLGDTGESPRWIKLVHGRGYHLASAGKKPAAGEPPRV